MGRLMRIGEFSELVGVSRSTLRRMEQEGTLIPAYTKNHRYYTEEQAVQFTRNPKQEKDKLVIGYCRVSTQSQKDDLETQIQNVKSYMIAKGYQFDIIQDIGSGINYQRKGLLALISMICQKQVSKVIVLYKDRLARFGFELIENICHLHGCEIEVIDNTEKTKEQELCDDLIQIVTVFANRLYGQRSKKTKKLIEDVKKSADLSQNSTNSDT